MIVIRALGGTDVDIDESAVVILGNLHQAVNEDLATAERVLYSHGAPV